MRRTLLQIGAGLAALAMAAGGQALAHEWYTGTRNPVTGLGCCDKTDCWEVADEDVWPAGPVYMVNLGGTLHSFDARQIQPSRDGKHHACYWGGSVKCLFVPLGF